MLLLLFFFFLLLLLLFGRSPVAWWMDLLCAAAVARCLPRRLGLASLSVLKLGTCLAAAGIVSLVCDAESLCSAWVAASLVEASAYVFWGIAARRGPWSRASMPCGVTGRRYACAAVIAWTTDAPYI